jgi:hypothetical protein
MEPFKAPFKSGIAVAGLLGSMLLVIAIGSSFIVKNLDRTYSNIVYFEIKHIKSLRSIDRECSMLQRHLSNLLLTDDLSEIKKLKEAVFESSKRIDKQLANLDNLKSAKSGQELLNGLSSDCMNYRLATARFIVLVDSCRNTEAIAFDRTSLFPAFITFQNSVEKTADYINSLSVEQSQATSSKTNVLGIFAVGISILPIALWILGGMALLAYIIIHFRRPHTSKSI